MKTVEVLSEVIPDEVKFVAIEGLDRPAHPVNEDGHRCKANHLKYYTRQIVSLLILCLSFWGNLLKVDGVTEGTSDSSVDLERLSKASNCHKQSKLLIELLVHQQVAMDVVC